MVQNARAHFDQLIERIHYPAERNDIIDFIREQGKGDDVVTIATNLENKTYHSEHEVRENLSSKGEL